MLIQFVDVQAIGVNETLIGFATFNGCFHKLTVMPTLIFQTNKRLKSVMAKRIIGILAILFSAFMVIGRLICGVHWFTDIVGSVILSAGLFCIYRGIVLMNRRSDNGIS